MIPAEAFTAIIEELDKRPLPVNYYRKKAGEGRSQTFGIVGKRCMSADYSRQCWLRPFLFKLLSDFADKYVSIPWNAITVNQNYRAGPHFDKHNIGNSYLVAFGDYRGGELELYHDNIMEKVDIRHKPIVMDFSKTLHSVASFEGNRFSLVFYQYDTKGVEIPPWQIRKINDEWRFFRGDEMIDRKVGLPHPLRKLN